MHSGLGGLKLSDARIRSRRKYVFSCTYREHHERQIDRGNKRSDHPGRIYWRKTLSDKFFYVVKIINALQKIEVSLLVTRTVVQCSFLIKNDHFDNL